MNSKIFNDIFFFCYIVFPNNWLLFHFNFLFIELFVLYFIFEIAHFLSFNVVQNCIFSAFYKIPFPFHFSGIFFVKSLIFVLISVNPHCFQQVINF